MTRSHNPVLFLTWALPLAAVVASLISLGLALLHSDAELPRREGALPPVSSPGR